MPVLHSPTGAALYLAGPAAAEFTVLMLPGGGETSSRRMRIWHPGLLRVLALAGSLTRRLPEVAVAVLRYSIDGWHTDGSEVIADARWALGRVPAGRLLVIGHSLGGRVALRLGDAACGVVGLAPWVVDHDPVEQLAGRAVRVAVGGRDRVCPPGPTLEHLGRAVAAGAQVQANMLPGLGHTMIRGAGTWRRWTVDVVRQLMTREEHTPSSR